MVQAKHQQKSKAKKQPQVNSYSRFDDSFSPKIH